jgi:hypothetical protein
MSNEMALGLCAGDYVEVRSESEILTTLDEEGELERMPFMPEMLKYCGKRFRVFRRADKTCDNIQAWSIRRVKDSVHLEGVRCDGSGHDECEAGCLIFWKEAWLKRVETGLIPSEALLSPAAANGRAGGGCHCTINQICSASRVTNAQGERIYSCQATELREYTSSMAWWDPRQYIRDLRSGNLVTGLAGKSRAAGIIETILGIMQVFRSLVIASYNSIQIHRGGVQYAPVWGRQQKTSIEVLDLRPGELVEVRSKDEIIATLDTKNKNRGLLFDSEMLRYCGGIYRVLRRVHQIVDEKTGKMVRMKYPCIVLEGVWCRSDYHRFCPRAIFHYWREGWLKRAAEVRIPEHQEQMNEMCERC